MKTKQLKQTAVKKQVDRRAVALGVGTAAAMGASMSHATFGFTEDASVKTNVESGAVWALGVVVLIYGAKKVIGFFGR